MAKICCKGFAAMSADLDSFKPHTFERYAPGDMDVVFDMKYCGMCHTDVHFVCNDLGFSQYPMVPGHELVGVVSAVGSKVTKFQPGDKVGVGCMVDSCLECKSCGSGYEQYCATGSTFTYGGVTTYGRCGEAGTPTMGGYSDKMVVHEHFAVKIPADTDLQKAAPLLCAGVTMYEPLFEHGCMTDKKPRVGIVGLGGLGGMGVQIATAMGCEVTAISTTASKKDRAMEIGAKSFLVSTDAEAMKAAAGSLDLILDTASADHELPPYLELLATHGKHVCLGLTKTPYQLPAAGLLFGHKSVTASLIGGMPRTQEMMDFCTSKNIYPDVEVIGQDKVMDALKKLADKNDQIKRFVIDCSTLG